MSAPFRAWLRAQGHRDDAVGDVARDVLVDPELAERRLTPGGLLRYLHEAAASTACMAAAVKLVHEYRAALVAGVAATNLLREMDVLEQRRPGR
jgi:hypothetical protein